MKDILVTVASIILTIFVILVVGCVLTDLYCKANPSIWMDDVCFDPDLRCEWECGSYGLNYSGYWEGCGQCYCEQGIWVSSCSGWAYEMEAPS